MGDSSLAAARHTRPVSAEAVVSVLQSCSHDIDIPVCVRTGSKPGWGLRNAINKRTSDFQEGCVAEPGEILIARRDKPGCASLV